MTRTALGRICATALLFLLCAAAAAVAAGERLHGAVLAVDAKKQQVIVRHDPFGGMPSMTMTFALRDRATLAGLRAGESIDADVDLGSDPWSLRNVSVRARTPPQPEARHAGSLLHLGDEVPRTAFVDQTGRAFTFADARGKFAVVSFIYTRCRDPRMCPLISAKFAQLQNVLGPESRMVEVTLDPAYDRPAVLTRYARMFAFRPDRVTLLTGEPDAVLGFAARFGLAVFTDPEAGLVHNDATVLVDPQGKIGEIIPENSWTPDEIRSIIAHYRPPSNNPLARLDLLLTKTAFVEIAVFVLFVAGAGWLAIRMARLMSSRA